MFDIKYDREGQPIANQQPPVDQQDTANQEEPTSESTSETTQNLENLQEMTEEVAQQEEKKEQSTEKTTTPAEKPNDYNIRTLREKAKRADQYEKERDEIMRAYIAQQNQQKAAQSTQEQEQEFTISPNDLVEGKHLSQLERKYQKKLEEIEKRYQKSEQQAQEMATESRIKANYPDFDKVVSPDNIAYLRDNEPELAQTLNASNDLYSKAVSAYKLIKKLGIYREDTFEQERMTAQKNAAKPKSVNTLAPQQGESPLSNANAFANGLTKDLKNKLWAEMNEIRKNN